MAGFLHGAYFEGMDVGREMAACIKKGCPGTAHVLEITNALPYQI